VDTVTIPDRWSAANLPDLSGKRFLITGATSGIGLAAATELARRNAKVIITARTSAKGEAARANFYVCATYHTEAKPFTIPTSNSFVTEMQDQYVLKRWNQQYPPTNWEIARHEYIAQYSVQNNRNPFIDHPDWACYIDFATMTYNKSGSCEPANTNSTKLVSKEVAVKVFPNPSSSNFNVDLSGFSGDDVTIYVVDFFERTVFEKTTRESKFLIDGSAWSSGNYLLLIRTKDGRTAAMQVAKP
jgi:hypothetical protein